MVEVKGLSLLAALVALAGYGAFGCGGISSGDSEVKPEPDANRLARVEQDAVTSIAIDERSVYWTDLKAPGVFAVDRDGRNVRRLTEEEGPDSLSATADQLFWLSYADLATDVLQLNTARTSGEAWRSLATGQSTELGSHLVGWLVPTDDRYVYWHSLEHVEEVTTVHATPRQGGESEELFRVPGRVWLTWLAGSTFYFSDNAGIHAFELGTRDTSTLVNDDYEVRDPVVIGEALYFVGYPRDQPLRDGLFRVQAGEARLVIPAQLTTTHSRIGSDGEHLYLADNTSNGCRIVEITPGSHEQRLMHVLEEGAGSNVIAAEEHLFLATSTTIYRIRKDATAEQ